MKNNFHKTNKYPYRYYQCISIIKMCEAEKKKLRHQIQEIMNKLKMHNE